MREIHLIRHGEPDFPGGIRLCLGRTDLPLSLKGRLQATQLGEALRERNISACFCSKLSRSRETAKLLELGTPHILPGAEEQDAGEWDGVSFDEIKRRWQEHYERRGIEPALPPPGGESYADAGERFNSAVSAALEQSAGDIAIVAHASVIQALLCMVQGVGFEAARGFKLPYGSLTRLSADATGRLTLIDYGKTPTPELTPALAERMLKAARLPDTISAHCRAVAQTAEAIARELVRAGVSVSEELTYSAALLHDIQRQAPAHAEAGAELIRELGYERAARIIAQHHDIENPRRVDEALAVYIADKLCRGDRRVRIGERFDESRKKCRDAEAIAAHDKRYKAALAAADIINNVCGKEVIPI